MTKSRAINLLLRLKDLASGPLDRVRDRLERTKASAQALKARIGELAAQGAKLAALGAALAGLTIGGVAQAGGFQTSMAEISTLVDTNVVNMGALSDEVKRLSMQFGSMPTDTARGFYQTISAGFGDAGDATQLMTTALKLGRGGITDTYTAVDGLTSVINAFGVGAGQATAVSDSMFVAMRMGKTTIGELAGHLGQVAPLAAAAGVGIDEMNAAVAALTLGGKNTSEAVTGVRGMLAAVIKPTSEATKRAQQLGIDFSTAAIRSMGFANWLQVVADKTKGSDTELGILFGEVEGLGAALSLTGKQSGQFAGILDAMAGKAGATQTAFEKVDATIRTAYDKAKAKAIISVTNAFETLLPAATEVLSVVGRLLTRFAAFAAAHPTLMKTVLLLVAGAGAALMVAGAVLTAAAGVLSLKLAFLAVKIAVLSVGKALLTLLANPVGLVIAGVVLLGIGLYMLYKKSETFRSIVHRVGAALKAVFMPVLRATAAGAKVVGAALGDAWHTVAAYTRDVWPVVQQVLGRVGKFLYAYFIPAVAFLKGYITFAWGMLKVLTVASWEFLKLTIGAVWKGIVAMVKIGWAIISGTFKAALQILSGDWSGAWATIKGMFVDVWDGIKDYFGAIGGWFAGLDDIFLAAGKGLITAFKEGLLAGWTSFKTSFLQVLNWISDHLTHSDARRGPLSDLTASGAALWPTFARGLDARRAAVLEPLENVLARMGESLREAPQRGETRAPRTRRAALPRLTGAGNRVGTINVVVNGGSRGVERDVERALARVLDRYSYEVGRA